MYPPLLQRCAVRYRTSRTPCPSSVPLPWPWTSPQRLSYGPLGPSRQTHCSRGSKRRLRVKPKPSATAFASGRPPRSLSRQAEALRVSVRVTVTCRWSLASSDTSCPSVFHPTRVFKFRTDRSLLPPFERPLRTSWNLRRDKSEGVEQKLWQSLADRSLKKKKAKTCQKSAPARWTHVYQHWSSLQILPPQQTGTTLAEPSRLAKRRAYTCLTTQVTPKQACTNTPTARFATNHDPPRVALHCATKSDDKHELSTTPP